MAALVVAVSSLFAGAAQAAWSGSAGGSATARGDSLGSVEQPSASADGRSVTVSWTAPSTGAPPTGYVVERLDESGAPQTVGGGGCDGSVAVTACTEDRVPPGTWRYRVTAANASWRGDASQASDPITVAAPELRLDRSSVSALPARITGQISNFAPEQAVTLKLDDPAGPALTGGISPNPVPASGTATVSVTLPAGIAPGPHTIYAVGNAGDTATAQLTVLASHSLTTSAWDLRDASGGVEVNESDPVAFRADARELTTTQPPTAFRANRYLQIDFNGSLPANATPSTTSFELRFAAGRARSTACFYLDVRRASTNAVIATHGSAAAPVGCVTGTGQTDFSTALPAVNSATIANDLRVRVFMRATGSAEPVVDVATVRAVGPLGTATLYDVELTDRLDAANIDVGWPLAASGGNVYRSYAPWPTAFSTTRYLRLTTPSYVPAGSQVTGASLVHRFRRVTSGTVCWYLEVLRGTAVIGTHGSPASPISCTTGGAYRTDTVSLPEINSRARANGTVLKLYVRSSTGRSSEHDQAELTIDYAN